MGRAMPPSPEAQVTGGTKRKGNVMLTPLVTARRRLAEMPDKSFNPNQSATQHARTGEFLRR
jgi:hypothetical protein